MSSVELRQRSYKPNDRFLALGVREPCSRTWALITKLQICEELAIELSMGNLSSSTKINYSILLPPVYCLHARIVMEATVLDRLSMFKFYSRLGPPVRTRSTA